MVSRVAVLGGTGFVGTNVLRTLSDSGLECATASRQHGIDLSDLGQARAFLSRHRPEFIVNCAAHVGSLNYVTEQAATIVSDNMRLILTLYEAVAAECPRTVVINPIANCAYPASAATFEEDHWWDGHLHRSVLSYGSTRRMLWAVAECYQMQYGVRSINLLVPNMYGPYDSTDPHKAHALNALVAKIVKLQASGEIELEVWGTGVAIREWLFAADFAKVIRMIIENSDLPGLSEPVNIGQNFGLSVRELLNIIVNQTGFAGSVVWNDRMPDGAPRKVMDDRRFRRIFPTFTFTGFAAGIEETAAYYKRKLPY